MTRILVTFWLRRFGLVFAAAFVLLSGLAWLRRDTVDVDVWSVIAWSTAASVISASISTYWAYKIQCKAVFESPNERDDEKS